MNEIFLDTSIIIALMFHSPEMKQRIRERLKQHPFSVSSLVVQQEFKRRILKEAQYLLNQLNDKGSFKKVKRHVIDYLVYDHRKRNICLDMLETIFEDAVDGITDAELTERARRTLRTLLRVGIADMQTIVNHIIWESGCACANSKIREKVPYKRYDFGSDKCSKVKERCGIETFLDAKEKELRAILERLKVIKKKSFELQKAEKFIETILGNFSSAADLDPCYTVGDLIIALESAEIPIFYTLNSKESQHLCRALNQDLIVRKKNPIHEDIVCKSSDSKWAEF